MAMLTSIRSFLVGLLEEGLPPPELPEPFPLCEDCGSLHGTYWLKDEVWKSVLKEHDSPKIHLCIRCSRTRLGRPLRKEDLAYRTCNDVAFLMLEDASEKS